MAVTLPRQGREVSSAVFRGAAATRAPFVELGGRAVGTAVAGFGAAVSGVGDDIAERLDKEAARKQKLADANFMAETLNSVNRDVTDEFERRRVEGDPSDEGFTADFDKFMEQRINQALAVPPRNAADGRSTVSEEALARTRTQLRDMRFGAFEHSRQVQRRAQTVRGLKNIEASVNSFAADVQRRPSNVPLGLELLDGLLAEYQGGLPREALEAARAGARSKIIAAGVGGRIELGLFDDAQALLDDKSYDRDLSPETRTSLSSAIATAQRRAEAEGRAEARENEVRARLAINDAIFVLERGKTPPNLLAVQAQAEPFPDLAARLGAAVQDAEVMAEFVHLPPAEQAAQLGALDAKDALTRRETVRLDAMARTHVRALKAIEDDPLGYADSIEAIGSPLIDLDFTQPDELKQRAVQARAVAGFLGVRVLSPLRPHEAKALDGAIAQASGDQLTALFQSLVQGFGRDASEAIAGQLAPGRPALAVAVARAADAPLVASEIVRGERLARETKDVLPRYCTHKGDSL